MKHDKVAAFIALAGQKASSTFVTGTPDQRKLGAQLLLSEVLEYCIKGLGVTPEFQGTKLTDPNGLSYTASEEPSKEEMLDGLADTAYTMYWNAVTFGIPLEEGFDLVCDNNLEKFVLLTHWKEGERVLEMQEWDCAKNITWPQEVVAVRVIAVQGNFYAVGVDKTGKVRKPSSYKSVELSHLCLS